MRGVLRRGFGFDCGAIVFRYDITFNYQFQSTDSSCFDSRCSVTHPVGEHDHRSYFLQNQESAIRMERPTDFFRVMVTGPSG